MISCVFFCNWIFFMLLFQYSYFLIPYEIQMKIYSSSFDEILYAYISSKKAHITSIKTFNDRWSYKPLYKWSYLCCRMSWRSHYMAFNACMRSKWGYYYELFSKCLWGCIYANSKNMHQQWCDSLI